MATPTKRRRLAGQLERSWDGEWYRRGYYDDGRPLGSAQNDECRIDSIAQSWAVLSGAVPQRFAERAMDAVRTSAGGARIADAAAAPSAVRSIGAGSGYIKGYPPGIRENGGQYTHAAVWIVMAVARLGSGDEAMEFFHMLNPVNHTRTRGGRRALQDRAVCDRRRRLRAGTARRPRRLELVHGIGWLDVSRGARKHPRSAAAGRHVRRRSLHPVVVARVLGLSGAFVETRYDITVSNPTHRCRGIREAALDGAAVDAGAIPLVNDGRVHEVRIVLGEEVEPAFRCANAGPVRTSRRQPSL